jgi:hypothetical protein
LGGKAERSEQDGDSEYAYEPSPKEIDDIPF